MKKTLAIFPLGMVLLPGMKIPLHIFEERYRRMIEHCIANGEPFGIVYYNGSTLRSTGCAAEIRQILKTYGDGRKDILIEATQRFTLSNVDDQGSYLRAEVQFFEDCQAEIAQSEAARLKQEAVNLFISLEEKHNRLLDRSFFANRSPETVSFILAGGELFSLEERQDFLECSSTPNRLQNLITAARRALRRWDAQHRIIEILGDSGDISHIFN